MSAYPLSIITPTGKVFDDHVESLMAPGSQGSFGVLKNHASMITSLDPGILTVRHKTDTRYFVLSSGVLEVDHESRVLILADMATEADTLDKAKEKIGQPQITVQK